MAWRNQIRAVVQLAVTSRSATAAMADGRMGRGGLVVRRDADSAGRASAGHVVGVCAAARGGVWVRVRLCAGGGQRAWGGGRGGGQAR